MRGRLILVLAVSAVVGTVAVVLAARDGAPVGADAVRSRPPTPVTEAGLSPRTVDAGGVQVRIEPIAIDETGATFLVALDTHQGDLGVDLARAARLEVGGERWDEASWEGDPPGGHHRQGTLRFEPMGSPSGRVRLAIQGLPEPVVVTWDLGG